MSFRDVIEGTEVSEVNGYSFRENSPRLVLADGESISVQASSTHYCNPRSNTGPYDEVECGYPSVAPEGELAKYAENRHDLTETVYGYVPIAVVQEFIDAHGGEV